MDIDCKIRQICGILVLVISVFLLLGWADSYIQFFHQYPSSASDEFSGMLVYLFLFYAVFVIGGSCVLSLPFYVFIVGYNIGKKVYIYIFLCAVIVSLLKLY